MDPWPFEEEDWKEVEAINRRYVDAIEANDLVVCDAICREMYEKMVELERKYGEHPVILEHRADFAEDVNEKSRLYRRALKLATEHGLDTLTIRLWYAELLLEEFGDAETAEEVLCDGQHELFEVDQDRDWVQKYGELLEQCRQRLNDDAE